MKRVLAVVLVVAMLVSALAGASFLDLAMANFTPPPNYVIRFASPENRTYAARNVPLMFEIDGRIDQVFVFLDGVPLGIGEVTSYANPYSASVNLTNLSEGEHCVEVWWSSTHPFDRGDFGGMYFTVDTVSPLVSVVSPQNMTYDAGGVPLNVRLSEPVSWVGYGLDGGANVTITDVVPGVYSYGGVDVVRFVVSAVLNDLSSGLHSLMVFAVDEAGNEGSMLVSFGVEAQVAGKQVGSESSPFPTTLLIAAVVVAAVAVCAGLLLYFIKFKKRRAS